MVVLSEKRIRERVGLRHETLVDVKTLSLPGSYHDKISALKKSLLSFTRLKHLDLSKNSITCLEGLSHLKHLRTLNLYFNNVPDLQEVFRLRHNQNLEELDLRLNPVSTGHPHYRLFVVHMLPKLRKLDDRSVRDEERQAALRHFSSDQAIGFASRKRDKQRAPTVSVTSSRSTLARQRLVESLARHPSAVDEDDCALLDRVAQTGGNLAKARPLTGSTAQRDFAHVELPPEDFPSREQINRLHPVARSTPQETDDFEPSSRKQEGSPPRAATYNFESSAAPYVSRSRFTSHTTRPHPQVLNDNGIDEMSAPPSVDLTGMVRDTLCTVMRTLGEPNADVHSKLQEDVFAALSSHWLQHESHVRWQNDQRRRLHKKLERAQRGLASVQRKHHQQAEEWKQMQAALHAELEQVRSRNSAWQRQLEEQASREIATLTKELESMRTTHSDLLVNMERLEVEALQGQQAVESLAGLQQTVKMLHESHRSLVTTNDHLLREIDELRERHQHEVSQLHWSYEQLKKMQQWLPPTAQK